MAQNTSHVVCANKECIDRELTVEKYYQNTNVIYSAKSIARTKTIGILLLIVGILAVIIGIVSHAVFILGMGLFFIISGISFINQVKNYVAIEDNNKGEKVKKNTIKYIGVILIIILITFLVALFMPAST
jgi:uncharacterized membrane protein